MRGAFVAINELVSRNFFFGSKLSSGVLSFAFGIALGCLCAIAGLTREI